MVMRRSRHRSLGSSTQSVFKTEAGVMNRFYVAIVVLCVATAHAGQVGSGSLYTYNRETGRSSSYRTQTRTAGGSGSNHGTEKTWGTGGNNNQPRKSDPWDAHGATTPTSNQSPASQGNPTQGRGGRQSNSPNVDPWISKDNPANQFPSSNQGSNGNQNLIFSPLLPDSGYVAVGPTRGPNPGYVAVDPTRGPNPGYVAVDPTRGPNPSNKPPSVDPWISPKNPGNRNQNPTFPGRAGNQPDRNRPNGNGNQQSNGNTYHPNGNQQSNGNTYHPNGNGNQHPNSNTYQPNSNGNRPNGNTYQPNSNGNRPNGNTYQPNSNGNRPNGNTYQPNSNGNRPNGNTYQPNSNGNRPNGNLPNESQPGRIQPNSGNQVTETVRERLPVHPNCQVSSVGYCKVLDSFQQFCSFGLQDTRVKEYMQDLFGCVVRALTDSTRVRTCDSMNTTIHEYLFEENPGVNCIWQGGKVCQYESFLQPETFNINVYLPEFFKEEVYKVFQKVLSYCP